MDINALVVSSLKKNHALACPIWTVENAAKYAASSEAATMRGGR